MAWLAKYRSAKLLLIIGVAASVLRLLLDSSYATTALVYVAIPALIALALIVFVDPYEGHSEHRKFWFFMLDSLIVMLATSALLMEGFICVIMFMPIYFGIGLLAYIYKRIRGDFRVDSQEDLAQRFKVNAWLALPLLLLSVEGVVPQTSFERSNSITRSRVIDASSADIIRHLNHPMYYSGDRGWLISIFPQPVRTENPGLYPGAIHSLHFVYNRWFVTNTKHGEMHVRIDEASPQRIRTSISRNDSYLGSYIDIRGTEVNLRPLDGDRTEVRLTIRYERTLDPYWYFHPLQKIAVEQSADYLLAQIIDPAGQQ
ncbi:MAG: hypothetical protein AAFX04_09995 [Pseudomonadota bacterium]